MKFRYKITCCMVSLLALFYGIGGTLMISISFQSALEQEKENAHNSYGMILNTLQVVNQMGTWNSNQDISCCVRFRRHVGTTPPLFHCLGAHPNRPARHGQADTP